MLFTFEESALLSELEQRPTLAELSKKLKKDVSVISRDLKRISEKAPVVEKINGRWVLTQKGMCLALWAKKISIEQNEILGRDYTLTIATTREFASRILSRNFAPFAESGLKYRIITCENGIEEAILKGVADFGFDCGRPQDPAVAFKQVIEESIVTVASAELASSKKVRSLQDLGQSDFYLYTRLSTASKMPVEREARVASNDIAVVRELLLKGKGWSTLPYYAVREEIKNKKLVMVPGGEVRGYKFGVWWLRGRESLLPWVKQAENWLSGQDLDL